MAQGSPRLRGDVGLGDVVRGSPAAARVLTVVIAVVVLLLTLAVLRPRATSAMGRALEAAAMVAATPLIASYSWGTHLVLLLLPMFVLITWALRRGDWTVIGLVAVSWFLIGPAHKLMQAMLVTGYSNLIVLRPMAEFGVVGILALWLACLLAVRRSRAATVNRVSANP